MEREHPLSHRLIEFHLWQTSTLTCRPNVRYNICGDLALHMVFLLAYIEGGSGGRANRHILHVGKRLIEEGGAGFDVNLPYENDLKVCSRDVGVRVIRARLAILMPASYGYARVTWESERARCICVSVCPCVRVCVHVCARARMHARVEDTCISLRGARASVGFGSICSPVTGHVADWSGMHQGS